MIPASAFPAETARAIRFLLTDIDDTLTSSGKLPRESYAALWDLHDSGIEVIPVTGRPAGWCDMIARQWPVSAVIGENGAFVMAMDGGKLSRVYHPNAPVPEENAERLSEISREVFSRVPGTRYAKDQFCRLFDVAVDFREEPPLLSLAHAEDIRRIFSHYGAQAKVSSIHVNAWFGNYNKRSMAECFLRDRFGLDLRNPAQNRLVAFIGDSPNDEPLFQAFENSVGVANIMDFSAKLAHPPRYRTTGRGGEGFAEFAHQLLRARQKNSESGS